MQNNFGRMLKGQLKFDSIQNLILLIILKRIQ